MHLVAEALPIMGAMTERPPTFGHYLEYAGWVTLAALLKLLPRIAAVRLARAAGFFVFHVLRVRRRLVEEQLAIAFGNEMSEKERRQIALTCYQNSIITFFEFLQPRALSRRRNDIVTHVENPEVYEQALAQKVVLGLSGHIGNWEALGADSNRWGYPVVGLVKPLHNPLINKVVVESRRRQGMDILSTAASMKGVITLVRQGKWPTFLSDQDARRTGIFVDFFGKPASTATGVAYFSYKLNLPIMMGFSYREKTPLRELRLKMLPLVYPNPSAPRDEEIKRLTEIHVRALEVSIREHPEDYFWLHNRWKTKPKRRRSMPHDRNNETPDDGHSPHRREVPAGDS